MSKKVLFICSHVPSPNAPEAGHKTAWRNLLALARRGDVDALLIANKDELAHKLPCWPNGVRILKQIGVTRFAKAMSALRHVGHISPRFAARLTPKAIAAVKAAFAGARYDEVWLEFTECAAFLPFIPRHVSVTISAPDVLVQWALRSPGVNRLFSAMVFDDELKAFTRAIKIIVQSPKDAELVRALYSVAHVEVEAPVIGEFTTSVSRSADTIVPKSLLFWGAMARSENSRAVLRFLNAHWPAVVAAHPEAKLYIVGSSPPPELLLRQSDSVTVTGFLDDPSDYFKKASLGIAPLEEGAGIKVKVLEMLASGVPVLSTPIGAEGIQASQQLLVANFDEFSSKINSLFNAQAKANWD